MPICSLYLLLKLNSKGSNCLVHRPAVLKLWSQGPLHAQKWLRTPKNFGLCGLYLFLLPYWRVKLRKFIKSLTMTVINLPDINRMYFKENLLFWLRLTNSLPSSLVHLLAAGFSVFSTWLSVGNSQQVAGFPRANYRNRETVPPWPKPPCLSRSNFRSEAAVCIVVTPLGKGILVLCCWSYWPVWGGATQRCDYTDDPGDPGGWLPQNFCICY